MTKYINHNHGLTDRDVTDQRLFLARREFIQSGLTGLAAAFCAYPSISMATIPLTTNLDTRIKDAPNNRPLDEDDELNSFDDITRYNNFYELGLNKEAPYENADALITDPWSVTIAGECERPGVYTLEDILQPHTLEERIYRLRCVEAWSMVIPWTGFALADLIKRFKPTSAAKYVAFETLYDQQKPLPGQTRRTLDWPYREGLRMDEAMHPLTFLSVGLYGEVIPNQNGAPIRLVVPWKYGFKSIKSIVKITFTEQQPPTSWNMAAAREYGFYSNVNPQVDHPRWSQARERRIGELFKRDTLMFNGYPEVAAMYAGMDLTRNY